MTTVFTHVIKTNNKPKSYLLSGLVSDHKQIILKQPDDLSDRTDNPSCLCDLIMYHTL